MLAEAVHSLGDVLNQVRSPCQLSSSLVSQAETNAVLMFPERSVLSHIMAIGF